MTPLSREQLVRSLAAGERFDFIPFYGHSLPPDGRLTHACFSQWYPAPFVLEGVRYATAEQFMMAGKARLFGDDEALAKILGEVDPGKTKALGRTVRGFDAAVWAAHRFELVTRGNVAKFSSTPELRAHLLSTGNAVLVEAAPRDVIWGIGLGRENPLVREPARWRGSNLLGFALMAARDVL